MCSQVGQRVPPAFRVVSLKSRNAETLKLKQAKAETLKH